MTDDRRGLFVLVLILGGVCTIGPFATDLYLPAMPTVAAELHASSRSIQLTVTAFLAGLAFGQLIAGPLSDTLGRRRPLLAGLAVFTVSSALCAVTPSAGPLIGLRAVQGLSGAAGVAVANAVVTDHFRGRAQARFLSRLVLVSGMAPIVAPLIGGQLLRFTSWRGVFVVLTGFGVALFLGVALGLRESLAPERRTAGSLKAKLTTMKGLSRDSTFMGLAISAALLYSAFFAYLTASSFVFQDLYGASPAQFSVLFSINAVGMLLASQLNHLLLGRSSPRALLAAGLIAAVLAGLAALGVTLVGGLGIVALAAPLFLLVASLGFSTPNATALALSLHPEAAGSASAYFGTFRIGLSALATPLVAIGGLTSAVPLAVVITVSSAGALAVFVGIARRATLAGRPAGPESETLAQAEASGDMAVG